MQTIVINRVKEGYDRIQYKLRVYFILTLVCLLLDFIGFAV